MKVNGVKNIHKIVIALLLSFVLLCIATGLGSIRVNPLTVLLVILNKLLRITNDKIPEAAQIIVWNLRLPRVILSFIAGGCISISGAVFQSVLKNPLASPYIIGISSGASLGAGLVMISGFTLPFAAVFTMPLAGFAFGLLTVFAVLMFAAKIDSSLSNNTVILCGMVFSLFVNAVLTTLIALFREELKTLIIWQMGSFSMKGWLYVKLILPFFIIGALGVMRLCREMDLLTFGDDEAKSAGVAVESVKRQLFFFGAVLTGSAVALSGTIGFVDLIAPHLSRRIVGSKHRSAIPMSFFAGGILMLVSDLIARTVISPSELPVGAVTAIIGAPFFAYVYFRRK